MHLFRFVCILIYVQPNVRFVICIRKVPSPSVYFSHTRAHPSVCVSSVFVFLSSPHAMSFSGCWFFLLIYSTTCFELFWTFQSSLSVTWRRGRLCTTGPPMLSCAMHILQQNCKSQEWTLWWTRVFLCVWRNWRRKDSRSWSSFMWRTTRRAWRSFSRKLPASWLVKRVCAESREVNISSQHFQQQDEKLFILCNANFASVLEQSCLPSCM